MELLSIYSMFQFRKEIQTQSRIFLLVNTILKNERMYPRVLFWVNAILSVSFKIQKVVNNQRRVYSHRQRFSFLPCSSRQAVKFTSLSPIYLPHAFLDMNKTLCFQHKMNVLWEISMKEYSSFVSAGSVHLFYKPSLRIKLIL